jgi:hypothetical protein
MSDKVLTYLQGDSQGARRDLIAHCYYDAAQGDPKSGPVVFAVLLDACAEQFAKTPQELVKATADFQQVVTKATDLERRMIERTDQNNAAVVAEFKDETRRANDTLREIVGLGNITIDRGKRIDQQLKPIATHLERIGVDLYLLKDDLKDNRESAKRTAEAAEKIQTMHLENQALVMRLGNESRANWITVGLLAGICLSAVFTLLPWWGGSLAFVAAIGLVQWLSRLSWDFLFRWFAKRKKSPAQSKPAG